MREKKVGFFNISHSDYMNILIIIPVREHRMQLIF